MIEVSISVCLLLTELRLPHQLLQHGLGLGRVTLQLLGLGRGAADISLTAVTVRAVNETSQRLTVARRV